MNKTSHLLAGRRIVVTRAREQAEELVRALERHGSEVMLMPTVCFAPVENSQALDSAIENVRKYNWILFTSANAARFFCTRCRVLGLEMKALQSPGPSLGAVGHATANAVLAGGLRVNFVAKKHDGKSLAREVVGWIAGHTVLLPRSDRSDDRFPTALRKAGAHVTEVIAYRTMAPETLDPRVLDQVRQAEVDAVVFASPSAFHNLTLFLSATDLAVLSRRIQFAAIGSTTADAMRKGGIRVSIEASESSAEGLVEAIVNFYHRHATTARIT